jgi:hypothetical protein
MAREAFERFGSQPVVGESPARLGVHYAGIAKYAEMVGDVGLPRARLGDQRAGTQRLTGEELHDLRAEWVRQDPQQIRA